MTLNLESPVLALEAGQVLVLDDAAGTRIVSRHGTVWVTEEGDREDHILRPGETLTIDRGGRTLLQALQPAWVALQ
jgi:ferric-dicitrate binding protein FerR (iron transport regulator)